MKTKDILIGIGLIIVGIIIDQVTKYVSFKTFDMHKDYKCIPGLFRFSLVKNDGSAWGMFFRQIMVLDFDYDVALGSLFG